MLVCILERTKCVVVSFTCCCTLTACACLQLTDDATNIVACARDRCVVDKFAVHLHAKTNVAHNTTDVVCTVDGNCVVILTCYQRISWFIGIINAHVTVCLADKWTNIVISFNGWCGCDDDVVDFCMSSFIVDYIALDNAKQTNIVRINTKLWKLQEATVCLVAYGHFDIAICTGVGEVYVFWISKVFSNPIIFADIDQLCPCGIIIWTPNLEIVGVSRCIAGVECIVGCCPIETAEVSRIADFDDECCASASVVITKLGCGVAVKEIVYIFSAGSKVFRKQCVIIIEMISEIDGVSSVCTSLITVEHATEIWKCHIIVERVFLCGWECDTTNRIEGNVFWNVDIGIHQEIWSLDCSVCIVGRIEYIWCNHIGACIIFVDAHATDTIDRIAVAIDDFAQSKEVNPVADDVRIVNTAPLTFNLAVTIAIRRWNCAKVAVDNNKFDGDCACVISCAFPCDCGQTWHACGSIYAVENLTIRQRCFCGDEIGI